MTQEAAQPKMTMMIICLLAGSLGVHRYMMGYSNWWMMLVTAGGCGLWTMYDLFQIFSGNMKMADGRDLTE